MVERVVEWKKMGEEIRRGGKDFLGLEEVRVE
jgi:hypothetical protein